MKSRALNNPTLCKKTQQHLTGTAAQPDFHTASGGRGKDGGDEDRIVRPKIHALLCDRDKPFSPIVPISSCTH